MSTSKTTQHQTMYGDKVIVFESKIRPRATSKMLIKVSADGRVVVHRPRRMSIKQVLEVVELRKRWIYEKLSEFESQQRHITPRLYTAGETHFYLGRRYQLRHRLVSKTAQSVTLYQGYLHLSMEQCSEEKAKKALQTWYAERAAKVFAERMQEMLKRTPWVHIPPKLSIKRMKTRWGSCSTQGRISLNTHLIKAPKQCIDYVILHELCHVAEHNHSPAFYALLTQTLPNWKDIKSQLDAMAPLYLND